VSLFSRQKQGILKELLGEKRLGVAVGWMETLGIAAILTGSLGGTWLFDRFTSGSGGSGGNPWTGALWTVGILGFGSLAALTVFQPVARTRSISREPFRPRLFWQHVTDLGRLWRERPLRLAVVGTPDPFKGE
jgi:MFS family permease